MFLFRIMTVIIVCLLSHFIITVFGIFFSCSYMPHFLRIKMITKGPRCRCRLDHDSQHITSHED